jgi:hypothetical protein
VRRSLSDDFDKFVKQAKVQTARQLLDIIEPPTYDTLEALIARLDTALHASTATTTTAKP